MKGYIYQINVKSEIGKERGLPKLLVERALVTVCGLEGDYNRHRSERLGGDLGQAVLLMPIETIEELNGEGWPIKPGDIGENITTKGVPYDFFVIGERYRLGSVIVAITKACVPCRNLRQLEYFRTDVNLKKLFKGRRGWYARVIEEGEICSGDDIERF